jgi:hypothetical protein
MTRDELERLHGAVASATRRFFAAAHAIETSTDNGELAGLSADAAFVQRAYETAVRQFFGQKTR